MTSSLFLVGACGESVYAYLPRDGEPYRRRRDPVSDNSITLPAAPHTLSLTPSTHTRVEGASCRHWGLLSPPVILACSKHTVKLSCTVPDCDTPQVFGKFVCFKHDAFGLLHNGHLTPARFPSMTSSMTVFHPTPRPVGINDVSSIIQYQGVYHVFHQFGS